jgi:hypothetical protein
MEIGALPKNNQSKVAPGMTMHILRRTGHTTKDDAIRYRPLDLAGYICGFTKSLIKACPRLWASPSMRSIVATLLCFPLCPAHASAQSLLAPATGKTIDVGLGYSRVSEGQSVSGPVGLTGGDASVSIGYSRLELKVDLGYARAATLPGTGRHSEVLSYLAGPIFHPLIHRNFETYVQVLAGAARVSGPVPLGGGAYLLGGWASGLAWAVGGGVEYRVTNSTAIRTGVDYMRTSYFDPSLTLRGQSNIRSTATIVYCFARRSRRRRLG